MKERLGAKGEFWDDYPHFYASKLVDEKIDYSNVENLVAAKTYVRLLSDGITYEELREKDTLSLSPDTVF